LDWRGGGGKDANCPTWGGTKRMPRGLLLKLGASWDAEEGLRKKGGKTNEGGGQGPCVRYEREENEWRTESGINNLFLR